MEDADLREGLLSLLSKQREVVRALRRCNQAYQNLPDGADRQSYIDSNLADLARELNQIALTNRRLLKLRKKAASE